ncbi:MAG: LptF/LptG family permease [Lentisphaeria bacterium]|nr:LptF/LptG family permease [Lentisphaeria bacterium]
MKYSDLKLLPRRWFPLWNVDGYILREFLIKYSILLLVFVILFILSDVYRDISAFLEARSAPRDILLYLAYKLPGNIRFVLPISMLLGCMWTMATFGKNMEITAMRASGISLSRCGGPIFVMGLIVTAVNIYFNEGLVAYTERQAELLYDRAADRRRTVQNILAYSSTDHRRRWLFKTFVDGEEQQHVTLKTFWNDEMISSLVGRPGSPRYEKRIREIFETDAPKILALSADRQTEIVRRELLDRKVDIYAQKTIHDRKTGIWTFEKGTFVSYDRNDETRFAASRGTSSMHKDLSFDVLRFSRRSAPETPDDILNAIREKDDLPTLVIWNIVKRNPQLPARVRNIYMTVFYYRLAFPWACFLAVFLGIPLATKNERTGSLLAIITAVVVIVAYIVIAQIFQVLGKSGFVSPVIAGLAPTIAFILCGAWRLLNDRN